VCISRIANLKGWQSLFLVLFPFFWATCKDSCLMTRTALFPKYRYKDTHILTSCKSLTFSPNTISIPRLQSESQTLFSQRQVNCSFSVKDFSRLIKNQPQLVFGEGWKGGRTSHLLSLHKNLFVNFNFFFGLPQIMQCETARRSVSSVDATWVQMIKISHTALLNFCKNKRGKNQKNIWKKIRRKIISQLFGVIIIIVAQNRFAIARLHKMLYNFSQR